MAKHGLKVYLASPYGFTVSGNEYLQKTMVPFLDTSGIYVLDPWANLKSVSKTIKNIEKLDSIKSRLEKYRALNADLAKENEALIDKSDCVLAVLDGTDVDSGVAAEIGYAYGKPILVYGLRSDFRQTGDNIGATVNLQVEYFIKNSGGRIFNNLKDVRDELVKHPNW